MLDESAVRNGPQAVNPVTGQIDLLYADQSTQIAALEDYIAETPADAEVFGLSPQEVIEASFPGATSNTEVSGAIQNFAQTCMVNSPDVPALVAQGRALGFDMADFGTNAALGTETKGGITSSFQINMASSYAFECAVTVVAANDLSDKAVRTEFFQTIGLSPDRKGAADVSVNGKTYKVSHIAIDGGAFGFNEHAFLLQGN